MKRPGSFVVASAATLMVLGSITGTAANAPAEPPKTGFEESNGEAWTTHEQEVEFLKAVDELSDRVQVDVIGKTLQGRPLHLVKLGDPAPKSARVAAKGQVILFVCTQHGNEPAGREACLILLRDLAFTDDPTFVKQLQNQTILFVPTANPDGREANARGNSQGTDVNRDHLNLDTAEAQAMAKVVRQWRPDLSMDHHEYGPSIPPVYDDEVLYLWPRNLNADQQIHDLAHEFANEWVEPKSEEAGYSADEYGQYEVADQDAHQSAGNEDEGIMRNLMGLRHSLGVLIETAVDSNPRNGPGEVSTEAEVRLRRVDSHFVVTHIALEFMRERGDAVEKATEGSFKRKKTEGFKRNAPVYWGGADNDPPEEAQIQDPPPCGYKVTAKELKSVRSTMKLLGISYRRLPKKDNYVVPMAQSAEPLVPLLLDERATRNVVDAHPRMKCPRGVAAS